jgi:phosphoribosylformylglycinamidine synthase
MALATDGDGRVCFLDPYVGGALAVAEATRNVACAGAKPVAITDCLNFGNPEKPEVYYQLEQAIRGMAAACEALGVPVVSGNVSLYNETNGEAIYPTPVVGALGLIDDVERVVTMGFRDEGDDVFVLGIDALSGDAADLAGSEYLKLAHDGLVAGQPKIDLDIEARVQKLCLEAARSGLLKSAHDCSRGGLTVALAKCCVAGNLGLAAPDLAVEGRLDAALFGEGPSRIVVSTAQAAALEALASGHGVPLLHIGAVSGERVVLSDAIDEPVAELSASYESGLVAALQ